MDHRYDVGHAPFSEDVDLFLDGELPWDRQAPLFRHLSDCAACRDYLNGVLTFRQVTRDESMDVPPWADDQLLVRIQRQRHSLARTARLHARHSLWSARATVSVRSMVLALGVVLAFSLILSGLSDSRSGYVYFEQERVHFEDTSVGPAAEVYVFYPGLTIEAEREAP